MPDFVPQVKCLTLCLTFLLQVEICAEILFAHMVSLYLLNISERKKFERFISINI